MHRDSGRLETLHRRVQHRRPPCVVGDHRSAESPLQEEPRPARLPVLRLRREPEAHPQGPRLRRQRHWSHRLLLPRPQHWGHQGAEYRDRGAAGGSAHPPEHRLRTPGHLEYQLRGVVRGSCRPPSSGRRREEPRPGIPVRSEGQVWRPPAELRRRDRLRPWSLLLPGELLPSPAARERHLQSRVRRRPRFRPLRPGTSSWRGRPGRCLRGLWRLPAWRPQAWMHPWQRSPACRMILRSHIPSGILPSPRLPASGRIYCVRCHFSTNFAATTGCKSA